MSKRLGPLISSDRALSQVTMVTLPETCLHRRWWSRSRTFHECLAYGNEHPPDPPLCPPFAATAALFTHSIHPHFSPTSMTARDVPYDTSTTARQNSILFYPTDSPSCQWKLYLLSNKSPAAFMATDAHSTVNMATQGSWWPTLQSHAQVLSRIKTSFSTSTSPFTYIQSYKRGNYLSKIAQFLDPPAIQLYQHENTTKDTPLPHSH